MKMMETIDDLSLPPTKLITITTNISNSLWGIDVHNYLMIKHDFSAQNQCFINKTNPDFSPSISSSVYTQNEINRTILRSQSNDTIPTQTQHIDTIYSYTDHIKRDITLFKVSRDVFIMEMRMKCLGFIIIHSFITKSIGKKCCIFSKYVFDECLF